LIRSLAKSLKRHPLIAITKLLPIDHTQGEGRLTLEMFINKIVHHHNSVCYTKDLCSDLNN
jgi:hypothetical protein